MKKPKEITIEDGLVTLCIEPVPAAPRMFMYLHIPACCLEFTVADPKTVRRIASKLTEIANWMEKENQNPPLTRHRQKSYNKRKLKGRDYES